MAKPPKISRNGSKMQKTGKNPKNCPFFEILVFTFLGAEGAILGVQRCIKAQITQEEYGFALSTEVLAPGGSIRVLYGPKVD